MNFKSMSDQAVAQEIGRRLEQMRLERDITQQALADAIGITRTSYRNLVGGKGKFANVIALLRELDRMDLVEQFVPEATFSPMEQLKLQGRQRRRASGTRTRDEQVDEDEALDW